MDRDVVSGSRILIVDDSDANILLLECVLQDAGYTNHMAVTDSTRFLDQFRTYQPDLILLDLLMPRLDGYALIRQLNGWVPDNVYVPILVMTADASRVARQKALSLGAKDFLTKPIDAAEATLRIHNLLTTRWLYRQMEFKNKLSLAHACVSKTRLLSLQQEVERVAAKGSMNRDDLSSLRFELGQASKAIERLGSDWTGVAEQPPLGQLPSPGFALNHVV